MVIAVRPFTPGDAEPIIEAAVVARPLTTTEKTLEARYSGQLADPNRAVFHRSGLRPQNVVQGSGEAVGLFTSATFSANGSVATIGIQKDYYVQTGGNFFHTHQLVNNQCFEYGINYANQAPTLYGYNWCTGGNTPQGWMNIGLVGYPGGILNTWDSLGHSALFNWDGYNRIWQITLEEVLKSNGWHLLAYNYKTQRFVDILNGYGVTGSKGPCCGWAIFENHGAPGASCAFDPSFSIGQELLYDVKMRVLVGKTWKYLNEIPTGGFNYGTKIDCANISGQPDRSYVSPYFSGGYVDPAAPAHAGDWWLIQS